MDAKVITAEMANKMMVWAAIGKPNQREWLPGGRSGYEKNDGLYPSGYALVHHRAAEPAGRNRAGAPQSEAAESAGRRAASRAARRQRPSATACGRAGSFPPPSPTPGSPPAPPPTTNCSQSDDLEKALEARRIQYRGLKLAPDNAMNRFRIEETKGVLFLDSLRRKMGDDKFFPLLSDWFAENTTKTVSAQSFLDKAGVTFEFTEPADGPAYAVSDIGRRLATAVMVYGTQREAGANRYAAEQLQAQYLNQFESQVPDL